MQRAPGPAPQFTVTTTTLAPGVAATAEVSGTSPDLALALSFGIPEGQPGTSGATSLDGLSDVDLTTDPPAEGEVLILRGTHFVPEPLPAPGATILDQLGDVTAGSPTEGQALVYNATTGQWEPGTVSGGTGDGASTLDELTDVDTSTVAPTVGQSLVWNGTQWTPATVSSGSNVAGVLVIDQGAVVPAETPEGTIIFERTT